MPGRERSRDPELLQVQLGYPSDGVHEEGEDASLCFADATTAAGEDRAIEVAAEGQNPTPSADFPDPAEDPSGDG